MEFFGVEKSSMCGGGKHDIMAVLDTVSEFQRPFISQCGDIGVTATSVLLAHAIWRQDFDRQGGSVVITQHLVSPFASCDRNAQVVGTKRTTQSGNRYGKGWEYIDKPF